MEKGQMVLIVVIMIASLILFVASVVWIAIKTAKSKKAPKKYNKAGVSTVLAFSGILLLSIWFFRFAIGYFSIVVSKTETLQLTPLEEFVNCLFLALRTFSIDAGYEQYIIDIKTLIGEMISHEHWSFTVIKTTAVVYASVLNLLAPIIGGAIILEIVSSIFPKIGLRFSYFFFKRPKYYFSELNPASLSLAKSIYNVYIKEKTKKPILIFTDTYIDDENEKEYELLLEARKYGAICVRDDLVHVSKTKHGDRTFFLMDENEFANLQTLMGLIEDYNVKYLSDAYVYLFVQSDAYVQVEKQINAELENEKNKLLNGGKRPTIVPVNGYRNLVQNLFVDIPLYEPLINKKDKTKLNITILGNGTIGTEAFLNAYWFGQIMISSENGEDKSMSDCEMTINIVSKDSEEVFWSKIDYVNPEIKQTVKVLVEADNNKINELLRYDNESEPNNPYCRVRYKKADVKVGSFWNSNSEETQELLNSDYFIVALGNDADNISVGDKLRRLIGKKHLESDNTLDQVVIAYAVFDSEIAKKLNGNRYYQTQSGQTDIYMFAFGSLDSVYSCDNVYMSRYKLLAEAIGISYDESRIQKKLKKDNDDRKDNEYNNYNYWANLARAMHIKYKAFSLGLIDKSIFDYDYAEDDMEKEHKDYIKEQCKKYIRLAVTESPQRLCDDMKDVYRDAELKKHLLAWLEHRRWNAFTRTMGYQNASAKTLFEKKNSQKDMELRLHSCLVEARRPQLKDGDTYIYADFMENGLVDMNTAFVSFSKKALDRLDQVSYERKQRKSPETVDDFKMYDYFRYEFYHYFDDNDLAQLLKYLEEHDYVQTKSD